MMSEYPFSRPAILSGEELVAERNRLREHDEAYKTLASALREMREAAARAEARKALDQALAFSGKAPAQNYESATTSEGLPVYRETEKRRGRNGYTKYSSWTAPTEMNLPDGSLSELVLRSVSKIRRSEDIRHLRLDSAMEDGSTLVLGQISYKWSNPLQPPRDVRFLGERLIDASMSDWQKSIFWMMGEEIRPDSEQALFVVDAINEVVDRINPARSG